MSLIEYYEKLEPWICTPIDRTSRAYLEAHLVLLSEEYARFLNLFVLQHDDQPDEQRKLRVQHHLLHDAQMRGGTALAVCEAYVNLCGGFILDLPPWLQTVDTQLRLLAHPGSTARFVTTCVLHLKDAIEQTLASDGIPAEVVAELQYQLGSLFLSSSFELSGRGFARAIEYYEAASCIYTAERYPLQYAKTVAALGTAYGHLSVEMPHEYLAQAIHCYESAWQVSNTYSVLHSNVV